MMATTGAIGAAKGAGVGIGVYESLEQAVGEQVILKSYQADKNQEIYKAGYGLWKSDLLKILN